MSLARLLSLALLAAPALTAADPAVVAAAMAQPADPGRYPQAGAVVLLDERVVTLDGLGRTTTEAHLLIRILQERAISELGDLKVPFLGDAQSCEVLAARTHLPGGDTRTPEATGVMEVSDPEAAEAPFYSNARLKVISFPDLQAGAVIELQYRIQPLPDAPQPEPFMGEMLFGGAEPILACSLILRVPRQAGLKYQMFNGGPAPSVQAHGTMVDYAWVVRNQPGIAPESGMVPYQELAPRLVWTIARDRRQLGRWLFQRFQAAAGATPDLRAQARALTAGCAGAEAQVDRLARFVTQDLQDVRLGLGRVGYRPTPARTVLVHRYADARDKFVLFQALLGAVGLSAQPVFVQERRARISRLACLPEYQALLARVLLPSGIRYYNLSQSQARLGELLPLDAGRPALLAAASGGRTITTPAADPRRQFVHARWQLALDGRGNLAGSLTLRFGGLFDQQLRERLIACTPEERAVLFQTLVGRIKPGARLAGFQVSDLLDLTLPPVVHLELRIPAFAHRQGTLMILDLPGDLTPLGDPLVQPIEPAVSHPFLVPASYAMTAELVLRLPAGYGTAHQPRNLGVRQGPFAFRIDCVGRPGRLLLNSAITWRRAVVRPKAYPALWRAFSAASGPAHGLILLERTGPDMKSSPARESSAGDSSRSRPGSAGPPGPPWR